MSTTAASVNVRHESVEQVLDFLRRRIMGPDTKDGPIAFAGLVIEALDCKDELAYTKSFLQEHDIDDQEIDKLASHGVDYYSFNIRVYITSHFNSIFFDNAHLIAEILCRELTQHLDTQALIIIRDEYSYCVYDAGNLVVRLPLPDDIRRIWPNALTL